MSIALPRPRRIRFAAIPVVLLLAAAPLVLAQSAKGPTKQMTPADLKAWKTIRQSVLSNDGKWLVYVLAPNEGDANLIIRSTGTDNKETKLPIGDVGQGGGTVTVSGDSRWVAYTISPPSTAGRGGRGAGRGGAGATPAAPAQIRRSRLRTASGTDRTDATRCTGRARPHPRVAPDDVAHRAGWLAGGERRWSIRVNRR